MKQEFEKVIKEVLNGFFTVNVTNKIVSQIAEMIMRSGIISKEDNNEQGS